MASIIEVNPKWWHHCKCLAATNGCGNLYPFLNINIKCWFIVISKFLAGATEFTFSLFRFVVWEKGCRTSLSEPF